MKISKEHSKKARILLVDDRPLARCALRQAIDREEDMVVCGEAEDCEEALNLLAASSPRMAVVDLSLKNSNGLELVEVICRKHPDVLTLVLPMHNEFYPVVRSIKAGAMGYITKQEAPNEVSPRNILQMAAIYWRPKAAVETVKRLINKGFMQEGDIARQPSERKLQVCELIDLGSTSAQIAAIVDVVVSTVDTDRSRIKEILGFKGVARLRHEANSMEYCEEFPLIALLWAFFGIFGYRFA